MLVHSLQPLEVSVVENDQIHDLQHPHGFLQPWAVTRVSVSNFHQNELQT